jgi:hypothetical protein
MANQELREAFFPLTGKHICNVARAFGPDQLVFLMGPAGMNLAEMRKIASVLSEVGAHSHAGAMRKYIQCYERLAAKHREGDRHA